MTPLLIAATLFLHPVPPPTHFQFVVSPTSHGYEMTCTTGCAWKSLTFGCEADCRTIVDDRGVYLDSDHVPAPDAAFAFEFHRTADGWELTSIAGTNWRSLSWGCSLLPCDAQVDESGVRGPS